MTPDPHAAFALELRWRVPGRYDEAAFISDARVLVADTAWHARTLLDVETGAELPLAVPMVAARVKAAAGVVLGDDGLGGLVVWREATASGIRVDAPMREPWAVSGDGRVAVVYDEQAVRPVRIDLAAGTRVEMATLPFREQGPISVALDHTGGHAAFGGTRGELVVVAVADGALLWRESVTGRALVHTLWSPGDRWLAVRDERGWISIHDARNTIRLDLPRTAASHMSWREHDGGLELVTYGAEFSVYRLPARPSATRYRATTGMATLALNPRGDWVALPAGSGAVRVHGVATGELIGELPGDGHAVAKDAAFVHGGDDALAITWPGHFSLGVWRPGRDLATTTVDTGANFRRVIAAANGDILAAGYGREMFHFAGSLASGFEADPREAFAKHVAGRLASGSEADPSKAFAKHVAGRLASGSEADPREAFAKHFAGSARRDFALGDGGSPIDAVATPDGRVLAWLSSRGGIEAATGDRERLGVPRLVTDAPGATRIALSGDGRLLAIARPGDVRLVDLASGQLIRSVTVPGARICEVALSPRSTDHAQLAAGTIDGEVWLWDVAGTLQMIGAGHTERVSGLAFGPDGDWLLSAGWDGVALRWDLRGLATPPHRLVQQLERAWGQGIDHAVHADLR